MHLYDPDVAEIFRVFFCFLKRRVSVCDTDVELRMLSSRGESIEARNILVQTIQSSGVTENHPCLDILEASLFFQQEVAATSQLRFQALGEKLFVPGNETVT